MLEIEVNNQVIVNPIEEIRSQFRQTIIELDKKNENEKYEKIIKLIDKLKEINYSQYIMVIATIYKDVYCYVNYSIKNNEINSETSNYSYYLRANNIEEICNKFNKYKDFFIYNFMYILGLNNLFQIKIYLNLEDKEQKKLRNIYPLYVYDEVALIGYTNFRSLMDYYYQFDDIKSIDEIADDMINYLEYLYHYNKKIYLNYIKSILNRLNKYCYYYLNNAIDITVNDFEVRVIKLIINNDIDKIGDDLYNDKFLLKQIILRNFDDLEMGYPAIYTSKGYQFVKENDLNKYIEKMKKQ